MKEYKGCTTGLFGNRKNLEHGPNNLEQLADYSVGLGSRAWRNKVEAHLAECSECRDELAMLTDAGELLSKAPARKAPDLWDNILPNLTPRRQTRPGWNQIFSKPLYAGFAVATMAAIVAVIIWPVAVHKPEPQQYAFKLKQLDSHSTMLWNDPFADRVSLAVYTAAKEEQVTY